jgi:hypothetical protein
MTALIAIAITIYLLIGFIRIVAYFWNVFIETEARDAGARLTVWCAKGVIVPILIWVLFNFRLAPGHVASMPNVVVSKLTGAEWIAVLCWLALPTALIAGSYWAATTLSWLVVHLVVRTESRREIFGAALFWGLIFSPIAGVIIYYGGWGMIGVGLIVLLVPILRDLIAMGTPRRLAPAYASAIERIKGGKYAAAEREVIRQLERREDDFEGWMMLAGLYAKNFGDLAEAERTVREVCRQPTILRTEYCNALSQLAEWHLTIGKDPSSARRIWTEICETYPHSEFADASRRKLKQLSESGDIVAT